MTDASRGAGRSELEYRPEIDGVRGVAVTAIVLYHAGANHLAGGYVGVDVFFVISGYLIGRIVLLDLILGRHRWIVFVERRVRRIAPALLVVVGATLAAGWFLLLPDDLAALGASAMASLTFVANVYFWNVTHGYFGFLTELSPLIHLWSLAVEEQFYLLFPLVAWACWRFARRWAGWLLGLVAAGSLLLCAVGGDIAAAASFFLLPSRVWEFALGIAVALIETHRPVAIGRAGRQAGALIGLALLVAPLVALSAPPTRAWLPALAATLGTALVAMLADRRTLAGRLLAARPLVALGLISYSVYLWHQPVFALARLVLPNAPDGAGKLMLIASTLMLGAASWRWVEQPFRRRQFVSRSALFAGTGGAALLLFVAGLALWITGGMPGRLSARDRLILDHQTRAKIAIKPCLPDPQQAAPDPSVCQIGTTGPVRVALLGDSHASAFAPVVRDALARTGGRGILYTHAGCPPISRDVLLPPLLTNCAPFNRAALDRILAAPDIRTVLLGARWAFYMERLPYDNGEGGVELDAAMPAIDAEGRAALGAAFRETVTALIDRGRSVILIYPVPEAGWDVPRLLVKLGPNARPTTSYRVFERRSANARHALNLLGVRDGLVRVDPASGLCDPPGTANRRCRLVTSEGKALYYDDDHLDADGARAALSARWLADRIRRAAPARTPGEASRIEKIRRGN